MSEQKSAFDERRIGLVAISVDPPEDSQGLIEDKGVTVPLLSDPEMTVIARYGVAMEGDNIAVPSTFVVDRSGKVTWRYVGETQMDRPAAEVLLREAVKAAP